MEAIEKIFISLFIVVAILDIVFITLYVLDSDTKGDASPSPSPSVLPASKKLNFLLY